MPITLPPISRRRFLTGSVAAGAGLLLSRRLLGADAAEVPVDPDRMALLSDVHILGDATVVHKGVNMADHLRQACGEVAKLDKRPAAAVVCGDCAFHTGEAADYATFLSLVKPLREAGMPLHLALGNHDRRDTFWKAVPPAEGVKRPVEDRQTLAFQSPRTNWFVLDSLDKTNATPGIVGEKQIAWLAGA